MTWKKLEEILRRYASWREKADSERLTRTYSQIRYVPEFKAFDAKLSGFECWTGKMDMFLTPVMALSPHEIQISVVQRSFFRRRKEAVEYVLNEFSGGKSPEEIVLEMEAAGA